MNDTGTCGHCKRKYLKCKHNFWHQQFCSLPDCRTASRKLSKKNYKKRQQQKLHAFQAQHEANMQSQKPDDTSKRIHDLEAEIADLRRQNATWGDLVKMQANSLSQIFVVLQGLASHLSGSSGESNTGDFARSFLRRVYDVGASLYQAAKPIVNLSEILYAHQTSDLPASPAADAIPLQLARPPAGPSGPFKPPER